MVGLLNKYGAYLKLKSNMNFISDYTYIGESTENRFFKNTIAKGRFAFTGGVIWRTSSWLFIQSGLGYGNRWVNWETVSGESFRVNDLSYKGLELEGGFVIKLNKIAFNFSVNSTSLEFNYIETNMGIGLVF